MEGGGQIRIFRPHIFMSRKVRTSCKRAQPVLFCYSFRHFQVLSWWAEVLKNIRTENPNFDM